MYFVSQITRETFIRYFFLGRDIAQFVRMPRNSDNAILTQLARYTHPWTNRNLRDV